MNTKLRGVEKNDSAKSSNPFVAKTVTQLTGRGTAVDLGAGTLRDSIFLLGSGFQKVVAVDASPNIEELGKQLDEPRLEIVHSAIEDIDFQRYNPDLIISMWTLFFIQKKLLHDIFQKINQSLKSDGIFIFTLLGENDSWANHKKITIFSYNELSMFLQECFPNKKIIIKEQERDGVDLSKTMKHWHVFYCSVAR